jgi:hypothetical protein
MTLHSDIPRDIPNPAGTRPGTRELLTFSRPRSAWALTFRTYGAGCAPSSAPSFATAGVGSAFPRAGATTRKAGSIMVRHSESPPHPANFGF